MIHLIPKDGSKVRDPASGKPLDANGIKMEKLNSFWHKRLSDGSVMVAPVAAKKSENSKEEKSK